MSLSCRAVYTIFAIEWLQTILITDDAFDKYALHYGDVDNLVKLRLAWFSVPVLGGIVSAAVQLYYARRIWLLSKSEILAGVIAVVCTLKMHVRPAIPGPKDKVLSRIALACSRRSRYCQRRSGKKWVFIFKNCDGILRALPCPDRSRIDLRHRPRHRTKVCQLFR